jgi:hypothetical protein
MADSAEKASGGQKGSDTKSETENSKPAATQTVNKPKGSGTKIVFVACSCLLISVLVVACAVAAYLLLKDKGGGGSQKPTFDITLSEIVESGSATVGVSGGELTVEDAENPLHGLRILVDEGLVEADEQITVGYREVTDLNLPENLNLLSDVIVLEKANPELLFSHPVAVQVPYDKTKAQGNLLVAVYEYHPEDQSIEETTLIDHDAENGTVTFLTTHFSEYVVVELLSTVEEMVSNAADTGFEAARDGWFITNWGGYITDSGNCLGMSAMSKYAFSSNLSGDAAGTFYQRYRQGDVDDELDDVIAQELAARSQLSLINRWSEFVNDINRYHDAFGLPLGHSAGSKAQGQSLIMGLIVTGQPQLLYVHQKYRDGTWGSAHAVLVTGYDGEYFHIYDPNYPYRASDPEASEKRLKWSPDVGFEIYDSATVAGGPGLQFNVFYHIGSNLFTQNSILSGLWGKATAGFPDDEYPVITFSTPEEGAQIGEKSVVVAGTIDGGRYATEAGEKFLHWYYPNGKGGLDYLRGTVGTDGTFSQELPVVPGENWIHVIAAGSQPTNEWAGFARTHFTGTILPSDMIITLSWGTNLSDIDLHVTDPTGYHVYYSDKVSTIGAALDIDDTDGYGPEHYTISSEEGDQMPYGDYVVKVVYYADHDENYDAAQATPYTVNLKWVKAVLQTGEKIWEEDTVTGVLTYEDEEQAVYTISHVEPDLSNYELDLNPWGV